MLVAQNQKGIIKMDMEDNAWSEIISPDNKFIITYGSNGKGKSTIKEMLDNPNLKENHYINEEENIEYKTQINEFYENFTGKQFIKYDEKFVDDFVYTKDGMNKNGLKIILKTNAIKELLAQKESRNNLINEIISRTSIRIGEIDELLKNTFNIASDKKISNPQKRFAECILKGENLKKYENFFDLEEQTHKQWWYEGLVIYKQKELKYCPWCKSVEEHFDSMLKEQINNITGIEEIKTKYFSDIDDKKTNLNKVKNNGNINENTIEIINELLSLLETSIEENKETQIIENMRIIYDNLIHDKKIFENIIEKARFANNILEENTTELVNELKDLAFFEMDEELKLLSDNIDEFIATNKELVEQIKESNNDLIKMIGEDEQEINELLATLGLKYEIKVQADTIIDGKNIDDGNFVLLQTLNKIDISDEFIETLSFGEKSTLAFAIFIRQIQNIDNPEDTIVIFDDPISSYDIFRRYTSASIINQLTCKGFYKIFLFTHERTFVTSLRNAMQNELKTIVIREVGDGQIELHESNEKFNSEIKLYKDMINFQNNNFTISQRVLALRKLTEIYADMSSEKKKNLNDYLCKLVHYRKKDKNRWTENYTEDIKKIYCYFGVNYDNQIETIKDEKVVFDDIENLYSQIIKKDLYEITVEEILSLRMIAEYKVREESNDKDRFNKNKLALWRINDSNTRCKLENYRALLNSICHIDEDEINLPLLSVEDYKVIPKMIIQQIIDILK